MENQTPETKKPESNNLIEADPAPGGETELSSNAAAAPATPAKKTSLLRRLLSFNNKYFFIFILLLLVMAAIIYIVITANKKSTPQNSKAQSLTSSQLATLKGSTTIVGDSQQTLDVQSNAVFEGQVLVRSSLDVAGSLKVGNGLTLPSITVGGNSSFGNAQINGTLSVAGDTTLQGQVNLQKNLAVVGSGSFGSLSASQINVSTLQLTGDLTINRHIVLNGPLPTRSNGSALGNGGTASVSGSDTAGTVSINTGIGPPAGCFVTINFSQKYASTPHVVISPSNASAGSLDYYSNRSATSFSICSVNAAAASTTYLFDYAVID